ncbi:hypothetical protein Bbelb_352450 [Branchiostoma belcheri]|nr:hypothetical protein Bbelb_352450 [Branchiostoma belcheri]
MNAVISATVWKRFIQSPIERQGRRCNVRARREHSVSTMRAQNGSIFIQIQNMMTLALSPRSLTAPFNFSSRESATALSRHSLCDLKSAKARRERQGRHGSAMKAR